ncbi:MAG: aspartate/glutamate racemase family protein [Microbacterium enclense]
MMRLTWIEATVGEPAHAPLWDLLTGHVERLAAGRAQVRLRHVGVDAGGIRTPANRLLSDAAVLATALHAQDTSDAVVVGCWGAPTAAVRGAVSVPVSTLTDAVARTAGSLARRAAVVTVAPVLAPLFADDLVAHGASGLSVRAYAPESTLDDVTRAVTDPDDLIARFDVAARRAVDEGADAVIAGCAYLGALFAAHGYTAVGGAPDVPVWDPNALAMEHVLSLARLADAGVRPTDRGYPRPRGERARALAAAARRLSDGPPSPERTPA